MVSVGRPECVHGRQGQAGRFLGRSLKHESISVSKVAFYVNGSNIIFCIFIIYRKYGDDDCDALQNGD